VHHRGQADAKVRVGVHGQPEPEGVADASEQPGALQAAPVVVIREHHADRLFRDRGGEMSKATTHMLVASGIGDCLATSAMPSRPGVGSSRYSRMPAQSGGYLDRRLRGPRGIRVQPQRVFGNASCSASIAFISSSGGNTTHP